MESYLIYTNFMKFTLFLCLPIINFTIFLVRRLLQSSYQILLFNIILIIMKFKGHVLKINREEYTLKDQLTEGGFSMIYSTNKPEVICKVQVISQNNILQAYTNEKYSSLIS